MENPSEFRPIGATTYLCPIPSVLVGCASPKDHPNPNLITIAWAGIVCSKPPMLSISIRKSRLSHLLISETGEFTVNLVGSSLCEAMDFCGVKSGRDINKFTSQGLTPIIVEPLKIAPAIAEAPVFLSCKVDRVIELGSHDMFIANILQVHVNETYFLENGSIDTEAMNLIAYSHGKYHTTSEMLGFFGYSVAKSHILKRRMPNKEIDK